MQFKLNNFNINRINKVIGCYDDINNKEKQIVGGKKIFKKYSVEMTISPKNPKHFIVSNDDYEIGDFNKQVNIIPFIKNKELYFEIIDGKCINVKCYVYLDNYYEFRTGSNYVKNKIKDRNINFCWEDKKEKLEEIFINYRHFNYIKEIEWL